MDVRNTGRTGAQRSAQPYNTTQGYAGYQSYQGYQSQQGYQGYSQIPQIPQMPQMPRQQTAAPQPRTDSQRAAVSRSRQPVKTYYGTTSRAPKKKPLPTDPKERAALLAKRRKQRRKRQELRVSVISLLLLVPLFCILTLYMLILPRSKVSNIENRNLATFPKFSLSSYFSGEFTAGVAEWYGDTVPFRDSLKNASYKLQSLYGIATEDTITLVAMDPNALVGAANDNTDASQTGGSTAGGNTTAGNTTGDNTASGNTAGGTTSGGTTAGDPTTGGTTESGTATGTDPAAAGTEQTGTESAAQADPQKDYTAEEAENELTNGLLIVKQDGHWRCLALYGGGTGEAYAEALNYMRSQVDSSVNIYSMPAPLASQYYLPSNAVAYSGDQEESMAEVAAKLDAGITYVNLFPVLAQHTEEPIYTRTDHHWAPLGAYYAAQAMAQAAGVPFADLSHYEVKTDPGYVGTLYSYTQDSRLLEDSEDFVTYIPTCQYTTEYYNEYYEFSYDGDLILDHGTYLNFMGTDDIICKITTNVGNGRKLLIVKDSYGNAEIPAYTSSFDEIYVTDMRYLECNLINLVQDLGITDVLFTMCVYSVVGGNADNLMPLMTQNPDLHFTADSSYEEPAEDASYDAGGEEAYQAEDETIEPAEDPDYAEEENQTE